MRWWVKARRRLWRTSRTFYFPYFCVIPFNKVFMLFFRNCNRRFWCYSWQRESKTNNRQPQRTRKPQQSKRKKLGLLVQLTTKFRITLYHSKSFVVRTTKFRLNTNMWLVNSRKFLHFSVSYTSFWGRRNSSTEVSLF